MNIRMPRFSIRSVLIAVALLGLAIATAQWNSSVVASAAFTLFIAVWGFSLVGAFCGRGPPRVFWTGFAVFGWLYAAASADSAGDLASLRSWTIGRALPSVPRDVPPSMLLTDLALENFIHPRPKVGEHVSAQWTSGSYYDAVILKVDGNRYFVDWIDGSPDLWVTRNQINAFGGHGRSSAHAVLAILAALVGGTISRAVFVRIVAQDET